MSHFSRGETAEIIILTKYSLSHWCWCCTHSPFLFPSCVCVCVCILRLGWCGVRAQGKYDDAAVKAAGAGSQATGSGQERLLLHSVASLVGGNVIPGTGNTFDVATETQRIFLKAIDADEVRRRGPRTSEPSSASGHIHRADYKKVWLEGFARAILVRSQGSEPGYRKLRDVVRSYVRSKHTQIHRHIH